MWGCLSYRLFMLNKILLLLLIYWASGGRWSKRFTSTTFTVFFVGSDRCYSNCKAKEFSIVIRSAFSYWLCIIFDQRCKMKWKWWALRGWNTSWMGCLTSQQCLRKSLQKTRKKCGELTFKTAHSKKWMILLPSCRKSEKGRSRRKRNGRSQNEPFAHNLTTRERKLLSTLTLGKNFNYTTSFLQIFNLLVNTLVIILNLSVALLWGFTNPTPIQKACLPVAVSSNQDIFGAAETVTMKNRTCVSLSQNNSKLNYLNSKRVLFVLRVLERQLLLVYLFSKSSIKSVARNGKISCLTNIVRGWDQKLCLHWFLHQREKYLTSFEKKQHLSVNFIRKSRKILFKKSKQKKLFVRIW